MTPLIRQARPEEAALLSALALRSKAYWGYPEAFLAACVPALTVDRGFIERAEVFVAEAAGEVAGFGSLERMNERQVELMHLFVEPPWIGKGIGRALITEAIARARAAGFAEILIQGDPNAAKFYEAAGGRLVGSRPSEVDASRMLPLFSICIEPAAANL